MTQLATLSVAKRDRLQFDLEEARFLRSAELKGCKSIAEAEKCVHIMLLTQRTPTHSADIDDLASNHTTINFSQTSGAQI